MVNMPINMAYANAKAAISNAINETIRTTNLPMFLLEQIMKDLYNEAATLAKNELTKTEEDYQKALEDEEAAEASVKPTEE